MDAAWIALSLVERIGGKTFKALLDHFGDPTRVLIADDRSLRRVPGIGPTMSARIQAVDVQAVAQLLPRWQQAGVQIATWNEAIYPARLREIEDAPPTIFYRGDSLNLPEKTAAIIGTRTPSIEAATRATEVAMQLSEKGYTIVSGLARGIDYRAHQGALAVPCGRTVAVLGSGVLNIYPPESERFAAGIGKRGCLLSEFHPQAGPSPSNLVARNRIITGLSDVVIVVETSVDGGAMHAARFARAQGKPIYTYASAATGNTALLADGALPLPENLSQL
ncbi:MAG TPA: DNA-processing protein DprA [Aggregatilineales bacterium]|nr:DNA-processing protein DprA [Aggregatilineales bacterium]